MAIAAIPPAADAERSRWPRASDREPVATAPPPHARRSGRAGATSGAEPIDVDVLWEELDAPSPPGRPRFRPYVFGGAVALAPPRALVHEAYVSAMRRPARPARVDLLAV